MQLRTETKVIKTLGKVEKVYLNNTNLINMLAEEKSNIGNIRETFFLSQMSVKNEVVASEISDFTIGKHRFEVGGKSKKKETNRKCGEWIYRQD